MSQENIELKVWKDLAVNKQILMRSASDALGLSPDCSSDELKAALEGAIKRGNDAEKTVQKVRAETSEQISTIESELKSTQKKLAEVENTVAAAEQGRINAENRADVARKANAKEIKELKNQLTDKLRAIKTINNALADTPENVVKKIKKLKKEKMDEANAYKRSETEVRKLKKQIGKATEDNKKNAELSTQLSQQHRELHRLCKEQREKLESLVDDSNELKKCPELDTDLLESVEKMSKTDQ